MARVAHRLADNKRFAARNTKAPSLLQGLTACSSCGYAYYHISARTTRQKIYYYYYYYRRLGSDDYRHEGGRVCANKPVRADHLDHLVWEPHHRPGRRAAADRRARAVGFRRDDAGGRAVLPRRRAVDTAALAGLSPSLDERLREWDYGDYEGRTTPQIRRQVSGWTVWSHPCPGGENAEQIGGRADEVLADYRPLLADSDVVLVGHGCSWPRVLVGHGHFSRVLTARWLGLPACTGVEFMLNAGGLTVLGHERGGPRLDHVNLVVS